MVLFQRDAPGEFEQDVEGKYIPSAVNTSLGGVAESFPLRLSIGMVDSARLLQWIYMGLDSNADTILSLRESSLAAEHLGTAGPSVEWRA